MTSMFGLNFWNINRSYPPPTFGLQFFFWSSSSSIKCTIIMCVEWTVLWNACGNCIRMTEKNERARKRDCASNCTLHIYLHWFSLFLPNGNSLIQGKQPPFHKKVCLLEKFSGLSEQGTWPESEARAAASAAGVCKVPRLRVIPQQQPLWDAGEAPVSRPV